MTDAKELAAEHAEALRNIGQDVLSVAELGMLRRAAAALEAQAEEIARAHEILTLDGIPSDDHGDDRDLTLAERIEVCIVNASSDLEMEEEHSAKLRIRLAALEQAAAPFVAVAEIFADGEAWNDFDALFLEPSIDEEVILDDTLSVGDFRALARAAGGRDV